MNWAFLNSAFLFRGFNHLVGTPRRCQRLVRDYLELVPGARVLDIGCGTAEILSALPGGIDYLGIDENQDYINNAAQRYPGRGRFARWDVTASLEPFGEAWDCVLALGLLHHLPSSDVVSLLIRIKPLLKPGGTLVSVDGCFREGLSWISRFILRQDRGRHVRHWRDYERLAREVFPNVRSEVREDFLNIPHPEVVMVCRN